MDDDEVQVVEVTVSLALFMSWRNSGVITAINSNIQR